MKISIGSIFIFLFSFVILGCSSQNKKGFAAKEVYKSGSLIVTQISENAFIHNKPMISEMFPVTG